MKTYQRFHDAIVGLAPLASARDLIRDDGIDPMTRLGVYANAYFARIHGVLVADYPKLHALVGDAAFRAWVVPYLRTFPTRHPSLREAGAHLANFLAAGPTAPDVPSTRKRCDLYLRDDNSSCAGLVDLARLERARVEAFDGADATPLVRDDLTALPPEAFPNLRLRLVPTASLVDMTTDADDIWDAIENGETNNQAITNRPDCNQTNIGLTIFDAHEPRAELVVPSIIDGSRAVLVWRRDLVVVHRTLDPDETAPLRRLAAGATFAELCELVLDVDRALELLLRWLDAGVLVGA